MAERSDKLVGSSYIDNSDGIATVEPALEFAYPDPHKRYAQPANQSRQQRNCSKQPQAKKVIADRTRFAAQRPASA